VVPIDSNTTEVTPTVNNLVAELDTMIYTLLSQDKLLKRAAYERKEFKDKLEIALKELEEAKKLAVVVSDEVECDECVVICLALLICNPNMLLCLMRMMS
jgi:adenosyl cobinamide kinase/adenosyl cobinamide phosphate guanylyltransferase